MRTRTQLRQTLRELIHEVDAALYTDERLNIYLYEAVNEIQDLMEAHDLSFFLASSVLNVDADQTEIFLSPDVRVIKEVVRSDVESRPKGKHTDFREFPMIRWEQTVNDELYFARQGNKLIYPLALGSDHELTITYTYQLADLTADDQSWSDLPPNAQALLPYLAAGILLLAENTSNNQIFELRRVRLATFLEAIERPVESEPRYVKESYAG